jgi:alpha,alpha-trehalase
VRGYPAKGDGCPTRTPNYDLGEETTTSDGPIADHALISDCHSAALVTREGSIDWLCFPRFDRPSTFARILDDKAGHWSITPIDEAQVERRYIDRTMVLETTFRTASGTAVLVDALAVGPNERGHELGRDSPHVLIRGLTCTGGEIELDFDYAPRPEYGLIEPILTSVDGGIAGRGGADLLVLSSPVSLEIEGAEARGRLRLSEGDQILFSLHHGLSWSESPSPWTQKEISDRMTDTIAAWQTWSGQHQGYTGPGANLSTLAGAYSRRLPTSRPERSSPRPPRLFPKRSAGNETGTTGMPGCATRA